MMALVSEVAVDKLRQSMRGELITPDHPSYDEARKVWNGDIDRRPAAVIRCKSVEDVKEAVAFGRSNELFLEREPVPTPACWCDGENIATEAERSKERRTSPRP